VKLKPIDEQVVVIMGASSGIGRLAALAFARRGARVVAAARSETGLRSLIDEIRRDKGEATAVRADVANYDDVQAVADAAVEQYGGLDTWVHTAAVSLYANLEDTTPEEFRRMTDVNLNGQAYGAMAALPHLRRQGSGALIHVSSVEAYRALPMQSAYAAAKAGIVALLDALRLELEGEGLPIAVTNIVPAAINTPLFNKARTKMGVKPRRISPVYQPEVVVEAILYAAENPAREIYAGGAGKAFALGQTLWPRLMDKILMRIGFDGQKSSQAKAPDEPDGLFEPVPEHDRIYGDLGDEALPTSLYTRIQTASYRRQPMKLISTFTHGLLDYAMAGILAVVPRALGWRKETSNLLMADAVILTGYSLFTRYELGAVKRLPMPWHLAVDALGGLLYLFAPWFVPREKRSVKNILMAKGALTVLAALLTETEPRSMNIVDRQLFGEVTYDYRRRDQRGRPEEDVVEPIVEEVGI
jgi:NAD(P)-dependent dehydrogenase (short-subunit alcohol dehydrogenase family)